jgi:hypothetical protein
MTAGLLTSNGSPIPFSPQYFAELKATDPALDASALRAQFAEDGYVLLRGALPAEVVRKMRAAYLSLFEGRSALPSHGFEGHPAYEFVRSEEFRAFADLPAFRDIAETFFEAPAARIHRTPLRHFIPGRKIASRAHMDRTYIDGVAADIVTLWVPLGDSPLVSGGLLYLEDSHKDCDLETVVREEAPRDRANDARPLTHDLKWIADRTRRRWLWADYKAGDVVVHSPTIVHASTDPGETELMRISTDIRFHRSGSPVDPRWSQDWSADDGY